jgi:uncharacterized protein (DUF58 family)
MGQAQEFHYRLPHRVGSLRPGSHLGSSLGAGQEFISHISLYDRPDPRRLDLRASTRNLSGDWLVRVNRQRAGIPVHAVADVSASMRFGSPRSKLDVVAEFVESLGQSAFRVGDALGMLAFDARERSDLFVPAHLSRAAGSTMASMLRNCEGAAGGIEGLEEAVSRLAARQGLVFLLSDFHWPLARLNEVLDILVHAYVVPVIVWDRAEIEPPAHNALVALRDSESGTRRTLWMRPKIRDRWRAAVASRRTELARLFSSRALRPFYMTGSFDGEAMSHYFFEAAA